MIITTLGRILQFIIVFCTIKVLTTFLSPTELAKLYIINSMVAFFALIFLNPIGMFINRRFHAWNEIGKIKSYYFYFILYVLCISGLSFLILIPILYLNLIQINLSHITTFALVSSSLIIMTANQVVIPGLNFLGNTGWFSALNVLTALFALACSTVFVQFFEPTVEYWLIGVLLSNLVLASIGTFIFLKKINSSKHQFTLNRSLINVAWSFAWPIAISVGLGWIQSQSYRFIATSTIGLKSLGLFLAGYGVGAALILAFESIMTTYLLPQFYKNVEQANTANPAQAWDRFANILIPSLFLISFLILSCLQQLGHLMLGKSYWEATQFAAWGVAVEAVKVLSNAFSMIPHAQMKTTLLIYPSLAGVIVFLSSIFILSLSFGSMGIGMALLLSQLVSFLILYGSTSKNLRAVISLNDILKGVIYGVVIFSLSSLFPLLGYTTNLQLDLLHLIIMGLLYLGFQTLLLKNKVKIFSIS